MVGSIKASQLLWRLALGVSFPFTDELTKADDKPVMVPTYRIQHSHHILLPRLFCCPTPPQADEGRRGM